MSQYVVGLTGGIGCGKTTVADFFAAQGVDIIDADIIAREVVAPGSEGLTAIKTHFGQDILLPDGQLNRKKLRELIFSEPDQRLWLNDCLHPRIRSRMQELINCSTSAYAVLVVPLLFENGLDSLVNRTLVVDISVELQIQRTTLRDGSETDIVKNIINSQIDRTRRLAKADDIIDNQGEIKEIEQAVLALHKQYILLSTEAKL